MENIKPMNDMLLIRIIDEDNEDKLYFGEDKSKPKNAEVLAISEKCENKNFEVGKKVYIRKFEMIPYKDSDTEFFVSEKAVIAQF